MNSPGKSLSVYLSVLIVSLGWAVLVPADTWDEVANGGGDAGSFPDAGGTFQMSDGSAIFNRIVGDNGGSQSGDNGFDAYLITVTNAAAFFIEDTSGTVSDTKAFVYDTQGNALMANDDNPDGAGTTDFSFGFGDIDTHPGKIIGSPADLMDGDTIVLVIGSFGDFAEGNLGGRVFLNDDKVFTALTGPTGEGHELFVQFGAGPPGPYDVALNGARLGGETGTGCDFETGDVNRDGIVSLLDVSAFVDLLAKGGFQCEADINEDGVVTLTDVEPFVILLTGG